MEAVSSAITGVGFCIIGLFMPMLIQEVSQVIQYSIIVFGVSLVIFGTFIGVKRKKGDSGISVKMRDGNTIGYIGDTNER